MKQERKIIKRIFAYSIPFIILGGAIIAWSMHTSVAPTVIVLGNNGFSPNSITVQQGETVLFKTTRNDAFWPASNDHPTHGIYPEFDPRRPIAANESWSFVFEKAGTWKFHNHAAPFEEGVVVVKPLVVGKIGRAHV